MRRARALLLKSCRILFIALLSCTLLAVAGVLVVLRWPGIVINDRTLPWVARIVEKKGIELHWKEADVRLDSEALLRKRIFLGFKDFCFTKRASNAGPEARPEIQGCFSTVVLNVTVSFHKLVPRILIFGPTQITGGTVQVALGKETAAPKTAGRSRQTAALLLPRALWDITLEPLRIQIQNWTIYQPDGEATRGAIEIRTPSSPLAMGSEPITIEGHARFPDGARVETQSRLKLNLSSGESAHKIISIGHEIWGSYEKAPVKLRAVARGTLAPSEIRTTLDAEARHLVGAFPLLRTRKCQIAFVPGPGGSTRHQLNCPVQASLAGPVSLAGAAQLPTTVGVRIRADLSSPSLLPDFGERFQGSLNVKIEPPLVTRLWDGQGEVQTQLDGVPQDFPRNWKMDTKIQLHLGITEFQHIVSALSRTDLAIPAPLNVLHGSIDLFAEGRADVLNGQFPFRLQTRLASSNQKFSVDSAGTFTLRQLTPQPLMHLQAAVLLTDLQLELPRLEVQNLPRLTPDSRIHSIRPIASKTPVSQEPKEPGEATAKSGPSGFSYDLDIRTPPERPARLLWNVAKAPVPVQLNLKVASAAPVSGQISLASFPISAFRRDAELDHLNLSLKEPTGESPLDGSLTVTYTDYTITVSLLGTLDRPQVDVTSDPPLSKDQALAVLLFGHPLDELDPDQSSSVGNTRSALADGAISLVSLYVLASTPVQSIGYDPNTGTVSMKIRLAEGTSLNIRSGSQEPTDIGIQKRLTSHWTIRTELIPSTTGGNETARTTVSTFLEWHYSY